MQAEMRLIEEAPKDKPVLSERGFVRNKSGNWYQCSEDGTLVEDECGKTLNVYPIFWITVPRPTATELEALKIPKSFLAIENNDLTIYTRLTVNTWGLAKFHTKPVGGTWTDSCSASEVMAVRDSVELIYDLAQENYKDE
jgi:hypothetical protein